MKILIECNRHLAYWLLMVVCAIVAEGIALYYQYALEDYPCVLCIHIRIWVVGFFLLGLLGLFARKNRLGLLGLNIASLVLSLGLLERSYVLYGTENGWVEGTCAFALNFPAWFAIDHWMPWLFKVEGACGFTPDLWFGITMAEGLLVTGVAAVFVTTLMLVSSTKSLVRS